MYRILFTTLIIAAEDKWQRQAVAVPVASTQLLQTQEPHKTTRHNTSDTNLTHILLSAVCLILPRK